MYYFIDMLETNELDYLLEYLKTIDIVTIKAIEKDQPSELDLHIVLLEYCVKYLCLKISFHQIKYIDVNEDMYCKHFSLLRCSVCEIEYLDKIIIEKAKLKELLRIYMSYSTYYYKLVIDHYADLFELISIGSNAKRKRYRDA